MKTALIIHGTYGYPEENWFPWLKKELKDYEVIIPQFPTPKHQDPEHWFEVLSSHINKLNEESILIGHSVGGTFLLRVLEKIPNKIKTAVFVAPSIGIKPLKFYEMDLPFVKQPFNWKKIRSNAKNFLVFHSEDDPYIGIANSEKITKELNADFIRLKDAGHFNSNSGYETFPLLLDNLI